MTMMTCCSDGGWRGLCSLSWPTNTWHICWLLVALIASASFCNNEYQNRRVLVVKCNLYLLERNAFFNFRSNKCCIWYSIYVFRCDCIQICLSNNYKKFHKTIAPFITAIGHPILFYQNVLVVSTFFKVGFQMLCKTF